MPVTAAMECSAYLTVELQKAANSSKITLEFNYSNYLSKNISGNKPRVPKTAL